MAKVFVDAEKCIGCGACIGVCPASVFKLENGKSIVVNEETCIACHSCEGVCPTAAITVTD
jgi:NAD-dependent dihydropyrimidine dehydrogenase PreA subunit